MECVKNGKPYGKYVCVSTDVNLLEELRIGTDEQKWSDIVNLLSTAPMQFERDSFWRLKGPYLAASQVASLPVIEEHIQKGKTRQSRAIYQIVENESWNFEIVSDIAQGIEPREQFHVKGSSSDERIVKLTGREEFRLRRYTGTLVECRSGKAHLIGRTSADLSFATLPQPTGWASGANFALRYCVKRNWSRLTIGIILGICAAAAYSLGDSKLVESYGWASPLLKFAAVLFGGMSYYKINGEVSLPSK